MGGCRDEEEDDSSSCAGVSAIPAARLYGDTCTSLRAPISDGPCLTAGVPQGRDPHHRRIRRPFYTGPAQEDWPSRWRGVGGHGLSRLSRHRLGFFCGRSTRPYNRTKRKGRSRRSGRGCIATLYVTTLARRYLTSPRHFRPSITGSHHQHDELSSRSIC